MPVSRMRMRPWLEQMIDSNTIPGLQWVDKEKKMFSIPWKHAARHGWELDKDASLFKMWAIHTGKYVEGQSCDPKTWKANFRCAMNSLPDIEEVKDKSINKGHQAMRVFRMLPVAPKCRDKRNRCKKPKVKYEEDLSDSDCVPSPTSQTHISSTQDSRVDSTMLSDEQDATYMDESEVPEWSSLVEVGFSDLTRRFEVSPSHSPCPDDNEIIEICAQWERERNSVRCTLDNTVFLNNKPCTSPGSQWSDTSSADELDETPQYTTLGTSYQSTVDDLLNPFYSSLFPII